jgi:hypothetical protein
MSTYYVVIAAIATVVSSLVVAYRARLNHKFEMAALQGVKAKDRAKVLRAIGDARRGANPLARSSPAVEPDDPHPRSLRSV